MTAAPQSTPAPGLPPLNPVPAMSLDQFTSGEQAVSVRACENYARLYGRQIVELCAAVCIEQGRKADNIDREAFYIATGQCAAALLALLDGETK